MVDRGQSSPFPILVSLMITMVIGIMVVDSINEAMVEMPADPTPPDPWLFAVPVGFVVFLSIASPLTDYMIELIERQ